MPLPSPIELIGHARLEVGGAELLGPAAQLLRWHAAPELFLLEPLQCEHEGIHMLLGKQQAGGLITTAADAAHRV